MARRRGRHVNEGDTVVEVSTDKVDAEVPAPMDGVITKLLVAVDDEVPVGAPMAEMEAGEGSAEGSGAPAAGPVGRGDLVLGLRRSSSAPPAGGRWNGGPTVATATAPTCAATPVARRVAEATGVDLASVSGSGPGPKVTKEDVLAAGDGDGGGCRGERR